MVEHLTFNQIVVGSNPATLIIMLSRNYWQIKAPNKYNSLPSYLTFVLYLRSLNVIKQVIQPATLENSILWNLLFQVKVRGIGWTTRGQGDRYRDVSRKSVKLRKPTLSQRNPNIKIIFNKQDSLWALFTQNWATFRPKSNAIYSTNRDFRLFFLAGSPERSFSAVISSQRYFLRWVDSYNFLFNLFYVESNSQLLTNKVFIEESLAFNWHLSYKNYKLFRLVQPFFMFKDAAHGASIHKSVFLIFLQKLDFTILVDIKSHEKLLQYLQRYGMFIVSLVPINYSPWKVSYPIPTFSDSAVSQYYFLRWLFFIKGSADSARFTRLLQQWQELE